MNQHLHLVTLGVKDFKRSYEFYTKTLGWNPSTSQDDIAFFQMSGVVFAIYPREKLAEVPLHHLAVDARASTTLAVHHALFNGGAYNLENLDLRHVAPGAYELYAAPLSVAGIDAAPVRALLRPLA